MGFIGEDRGRVTEVADEKASITLKRNNKKRDDELFSCVEKKQRGLSEFLKVISQNRAKERKV